MEGPERPENGLPPGAGAVTNGSTKLTTRPKRKIKRHCPVCGKRLYQDAHERWYCPRCQAEVDGERISFNYVPEGELDTQLSTG